MPDSGAPAAPVPGANLAELSVSELAGAIKRTMETTFDRVRVRGELGRVTIAKSGHLYADLKDDRASLSLVMWKGQVSGLKFRPEEGLEVIAEGRISTFPGKSQYQLIADRLEPAGVGALLAQLEKLKAKLAAEGLFSTERKKPIPYLPTTIGVVTSPTGAVIRDILHRLEERFPRRVLLWPVQVQGQGAAEQIARAIAGFNRLQGALRPDVLIVARGGGSVEDLWAFNEEIVVRAAAASAIPLISAVGHETDTTLIDYASDRRAPTPTAAAEMAVPVRAELRTRVETAGARLSGGLGALFEARRKDLAVAGRRLPAPDALLQSPRQRLDRAGSDLDRALKTAAARADARLQRLAARLRPALLTQDLTRRDRRLAELGARAGQALRVSLRRGREGLGRAGARLRREGLLAALAARRTRLDELSQRLYAIARRNLRERARAVAAAGRVLETLSHKSALARGFALVSRADGTLVRAAAALQPGDPVRLSFADGDAAATIGEPPPGRKRPRRGGEGGVDQGDLF